MSTILRRTMLLVFILIPCSVMASDWPAFRGPKGLGVSEDRDLPVAWGPGKSVVWKVKLPGPGASSPIVWGDRIFLTSYSGYGIGKSLV